MSKLYRGDLLVGEALSKKLTTDGKSKIYQERQTQFFTDSDFLKDKIGKTICTFNSAHPDYEKYVNLFDAAEDIYELCKVLKTTPLFSINWLTFKSKLFSSVDKAEGKNKKQSIFHNYQNK